MEPYIVKTYTDLKNKIALLQDVRARAKSRGELAKVTSLDWQIADLQTVADLMVGDILSSIPEATEAEGLARLGNAQRERDYNLK